MILVHFYKGNPGIYCDSETETIIELALVYVSSVKMYEALKKRGTIKRQTHCSFAAFFYHRKLGS